MVDDRLLDAEMQTQSDPDLLEHIKRLNARPPLASLGSKSESTTMGGGGGGVGRGRGVWIEQDY